MEHCLVVTHQGPCSVPKKLYDAILKKKKLDLHFGRQILFSMDFTKVASTVDLSVDDGEVPSVKAMVEFEEKFILANLGRRNLLI